MIEDIEDREDTITSTRSNASADARRDFDGFDVDKELTRLRHALRDGRWRIAAELTANIDEHLSRGGSLPVAWLGPDCMQGPDDLEWRRGATLDAAAKLSSQEREAATSDYVAVTPAPDQPPGSSWGIHCHEEGCVETLTLGRTTPSPPSDEDDWRNLESRTRHGGGGLGLAPLAVGLVVPFAHGRQASRVRTLSVAVSRVLVRGRSAWPGRRRDDHRRDGAFVVVKDLVIDARERRKPKPTANSYRWDEIGNYVVSTIRLSDTMAEAVNARYETLVYSCVEGAWDFDGSGEQSVTEAEADTAHAAVCDRMRGRIQ